MPRLQSRKTPSHIRKLLDQLDETPEDWQLRLVIADAYEEAGDETSAECLRWTVVNRKAADYTWYVLRDNERGAGERWTLPKKLFVELSGYMTELPTGRLTNPDEWKDYETRRHSEYALRVAWRKARRKGWQP